MTPEELLGELMAQAEISREPIVQLGRGDTGSAYIRIELVLRDDDPVLHALLDHCDDPDGES